MKIREHHGIRYAVLKSWHLSKNEYVLLRDYQIQTHVYGYNVARGSLKLTPDGMLTVLFGYWWNGPSGLTVDTESFMRSSMLHDAWYRMLRWLLLPWWVRDYADAHLYSDSIKDGMIKIRATYVRKAVHEGGILSALPGGG